jgi:hypothetical protein
MLYMLNTPSQLQPCSMDIDRFSIYFPPKMGLNRFELNLLRIPSTHFYYLNHDATDHRNHGQLPRYTPPPHHLSTSGSSYHRLRPSLGSIGFLGLPFRNSRRFILDGARGGSSDAPLVRRLRPPPFQSLQTTQQPIW